MKATLRFPGFELPHCVVIGQPTRLLDIHTPSPLLLLSPAFRYEEHTVDFALESRESGRSLGWRNLLAERGRRTFPDSAIVFDTRHDAPGNLAHVLQNRIGPLMAGLEALGLSDRLPDVEIIVHRQATDYELDLFRVLGFEKVHATAQKVAGHCLRMSPEEFPLRSCAGRCVRRRAIEIGLLSDRDVAGDPIFIKRKRRTATNLDDVTRVARSAGYEDVFLETLPMKEQIRRVATAERIFAFHGAALGHLYFRDPSRRGCVIEAFSSGFANNWARANAIMMGDAWIGLQGELEAKAIRGLAGGVHHHTFEGMDFHLDESTVQMALKLAEQEAGDLDHAVASLRVQSNSTITVAPDRRGVA